MKTRTDTKRALLEATQELLKEKSRFTVKDISERAYTNVAAVNYHFGSKDKLVALALNEIFHRFKASVTERISGDYQDSRQGLGDVTEFVLDFFSEYKGTIRYVLLDTEGGNGGRFAQEFFSDSRFVEGILDKIGEISGERDRRKLFNKYSISVSAFLVPLMLEGEGDESPCGFSALMGDRESFIETLALLFCRQN